MSRACANCTMLLDFQVWPEPSLGTLGCPGGCSSRWMPIFVSFLTKELWEAGSYVSYHLSDGAFQLARGALCLLYPASRTQGCLLLLGGVQDSHGRHSPLPEQESGMPVYIRLPSSHLLLQLLLCIVSWLFFPTITYVGTDP